MFLNFVRLFVWKTAVNKRLIITMLILCTSPLGESFADEVNLLVEQAPPYTEQARQDKGLISARVIAAFEQSNVKVNLNFANWHQVERQVDANRQVSFMWVKTKPLMKKWLFSDPIYIQQNKFAVVTDTAPPVARLDQLRGLKIGVTNGFSYGQGFDNFLPKLKVTRSDSDYQTLNKLLNAEVAMIAIDPPVASDLFAKYFKQAKPSKLKFIEAPYLSQTEYFLVCAKKYGNCVNLIKKFNQGLVKIKNTDKQNFLTAPVAKTR